MNYTNGKIVVIEADPLSVLPLQYAKNYLRIDNNNDDEFLVNAIATAINYAEAITGKIFGEKTYKLTCNVEGKITNINKLPILVNEIVEIQINQQPLNKENYFIKNGIIQFKEGVTGDLVVVFKAGIQAGEVLINIRQALMYHVASIYENKNGNCGVPVASQEIYNLYRNIKL